MIKIIFCDMDGTLLDEAGKLPAEFPAVAAELRKRGVMFAPASGRQYFSLLDTFKGYEDEFMFLAENGTLVRYREEELFSDTLDKSLAEAVLAASDLPDIYRVFCGKKDAYALHAQRTPAFLAELHKYYTHTEGCDSFLGIADAAVKVSLWDANGQAEKTIYPAIREQFGDKLQVVLSSAYWVDVMNLGVGKGTAVQQVQRRLGITPMECAAFGDYMNDAEMMSSVYYSFAMANAHPKIKELARYSTTSNNEGGVLAGIRRLIDAGLC